MRPDQIKEGLVVPTRYPNGLPGGVPYEVFDEVDAERAIKLSEEVVELVKRKLKNGGQHENPRRDFEGA